MQIATDVASRATCPRKHVGAVIVRDRIILSTGYNGSIRGMPHCDDEGVGCMMEGGHCVAGDTVISKFQTGQYNSGHLTIKEIFNRWENGGGTRRMKIRSMNPNGVIVPDTITDVWESGEKEVFLVTTSLGRSVKATSEHRFYTDDGWKHLHDINTGDAIALNGQPLHESPEWLRKKYVEEGRTQVEIASMAGCSRTTIKRKLLANGIELRDFKLGGWNSGLRRDGMPGYAVRDVSASSARRRSRTYGLQNQCNICNSPGPLQVHHVDVDPWNDSDDNLLTLCIGCHTVAHTPHAKIECVVYDKIVSIESAGTGMTYDMTVEKNHNFVGNGIILHNCVATIHAEQNAIIQAAKNGVSIDGSTIYTTASPCWPCFKMITNAGIKRIVFAEFYREEKVFAAAEEIGITLDHLEN